MAHLGRLRPAEAGDEGGDSLSWLYSIRSGLGRFVHRGSTLA